MAYILDGMTLAMEGQPLALTEDDDFAIQPFAMATIGVVVCPLLELDEKLADPRSRWDRVWDRQYYERRYAREIAAQAMRETPVLTLEKPEAEQELATITQDIVALELRLQEIAAQAMRRAIEDVSAELAELSEWLDVARARRRRQNNDLAAMTAVLMIYH